MATTSLGRCDLLVLGAFPPEIEPLEGVLPAGVQATTCGVGLVLAALGAEHALRVSGARGVVFLGTCGAFGSSGLRLGDTVTLERTFLAGAGLQEGLASLPEPMRGEVFGHAEQTRALAPDLARVVVATTLAITTSDAAAEALAAATGAAVEHLEAFAVGLAAARVGVPFAAILGVANPVGASGRAAWLAHHREATRQAAAQLATGLGAGVWRPLLEARAPTRL